MADEQRGVRILGTTGAPKEGGDAGNLFPAFRSPAQAGCLEAPAEAARSTHAGTQSKKRVTGLEVAVKKRRQLRLGQRTDFLRMDLAAFVQNHRRDAANAVAAWGRRV